jgi:hypothetical protein
MTQAEEYLAVEIPIAETTTVNALTFTLVGDGAGCDTSFAHALALGVFTGMPPDPADAAWVTVGSAPGASVMGDLPVDATFIPQDVTTGDSVWVMFNSGPSGGATACPRTCDSPVAGSWWAWEGAGSSSGGWTTAPANAGLAITVHGCAD